MTMARSKLVDTSVTRYYHCISRCVRQAFLCGEGCEHRKQWLEDRLELLASCFSITVCGFAAMDNHLHVLVRIDPDAAAGWSDEEVVRRWSRVYPPKDGRGEAVQMDPSWIEDQLKNKKTIADRRARLADLGWFMKALKEPLSRLANQEDGCRGAFWEGRYKSIAVLDEEALLVTCAYIDLNPVAAGLAATPETSHHTSIHQRVEHAKAKRGLTALKHAARGSVAASRAAGRLEQEHWLCPLEDRRRWGERREGMLESFSLGSYLLLVDYTGRLCRRGKARIGPEVSSILNRIGSSVEIWKTRFEHLMSAGSRLAGNFFATDRARLTEVAARRGLHHVVNLAGCPAR